MTYPTISHFIESVTGVFIPLPIQTFGLFIVLAFICGRYFIKQQFLRLESLGLLKAVRSSGTTNKLNMGLDYFFNGLISFLLGYKLIYIITNYKLFAASPQTVLLSSEGSVFMGLLLLILNVIYIYKFFIAYCLWNIRKF